MWHHRRRQQHHLSVYTFDFLRNSNGAFLPPTTSICNFSTKTPLSEFCDNVCLPADASEWNHVHPLHLRPEHPHHPHSSRLWLVHVLSLRRPLYALPNQVEITGENLVYTLPWHSNPQKKGDKLCDSVLHRRTSLIKSQAAERSLCGFCVTEKPETRGEQLSCWFLMQKGLFKLVFRNSNNTVVKVKGSFYLRSWLQSCCFFSVCVPLKVMQILLAGDRFTRMLPLYFLFLKTNSEEQILSSE